MELAGVSLSKAFLTVDAGPLHISAAVGTLTLAVVVMILPILGQVPYDCGFHEY